MSVTQTPWHQDIGWHKHLSTNACISCRTAVSYTAYENGFSVWLILGGRIMTCCICDVCLPIFRQLSDHLSFIYVNGNVMFLIYFLLATPEVVKTTISVTTRDGWSHGHLCEAHNSRIISIFLKPKSAWLICREPRHVILIMAIWDAKFVKKEGKCQTMITILSVIDGLPVNYSRSGPSYMMSPEINDMISVS